jgi:hypothetical protein
MTRTKIYSIFLAAFVLVALAHVALNQAAQVVG